MTTLITGAGGQDGRLLSKLLELKGVSAFGTCRPGQAESLSKYCPNLTIFEVDLSLSESIVDILNKVKPTQIYNLAGFSSVNQSWNNPQLTVMLNSRLPATILNWCLEVQPMTRFVQASSSEIFGEGVEFPQNEKSKLAPITPYGQSKGLAHSLVQKYRNEFGMFASTVILYNHESPLRSKEFVTRKVTSAVAKIYRGSNEHLRLGRIDARRDWGWAPDFVEGMEKVMNHKDSGDFVLATGEVHTVEDLIKYAFKSIDVDDYSKYVIHDTSNDRQVDPKNLIGDRSRAKSELIWEPSRNLSSIIEEMVRFDIALLDNQGLQWFPKFGQQVK